MTGRAMMLGMVVFGVAMGAGGMMLADRVAPGDLATADRTRIERVVRDYVLANPDIIPEALQKLQDRETGKAVAARRGAIETPYGNAWIGNPNADVTLVEFFDYNCGYCRASLPMIEQLVKSDRNVRVVFRELPVLAPSSRLAARASLAAAAQNKWKAFHDRLYKLGPVTQQSVGDAAMQTGVNLARIPDDADEEIGRNMTSAGRLGMTGTPSWVVGDRVLSGLQSLERLQAAVAAARAK